MITAINNAMVINKKVSKIFGFTGYLFSLKFIEIVVVSSIISALTITELSIIVSKYLPSSQLHVAQFQI